VRRDPPYRVRERGGGPACATRLEAAYVLLEKGPHALYAEARALWP
jgi:hypothetical protein